MSSLSSFIRSWIGFFRYLRQDPETRRIVVYAEDPGSWAFLGPVVEALTNELDRPVIYVTSTPNDPVLTRPNPNIEAYYIGFGSARTAWFRNLRADVLVMTMPDLDAFHIKRSRYPVHYAYIFHSAASTHMTYREGAFDAFDTILCVGPHHIEEVRATERVYGLEPKVLQEHGYGRLDTILADAAGDATAPDSSGPTRVLLAPTWGETALLETMGVRVVELLLDAGFIVTVRPHPMTVRASKAVLDELNRRFGADDRFALDLDLTSSRSLRESHIMVSDWSGAAIDYALGLERPVLWIDTPPKVNNPAFERIGLVPWEVRIRPEIGTVLPVDRLEDAPAAIRTITHDPAAPQALARELRERHLFNVGHSGLAGAKIIAEIADSIRAPEQR